MNEFPKEFKLLKEPKILLKLIKSILWVEVIRVWWFPRTKLIGRPERIYFPYPEP